MYTKKSNLFSQTYDVALGAWHETRESEAGISSLKHLRREQENRWDEEAKV